MIRKPYQICIKINTTPMPGRVLLTVVDSGQIYCESVISHSYHGFNDSYVSKR